jgi:hypothetical protein
VFFWTLSIVYISIKSRFGSWIFFRLQVKKEGPKSQLLGPLVELASDLDQLSQGAQQLRFLSFLFYLKTEEAPASEML